MPFHELKEADKQSFASRLVDRGRSATTAQQAQDLVVGEGAHVQLSAHSAKHHQMEIRRPANSDELSKWIGIPPNIRAHPSFQSKCFRDNAILEDMLSRTKLLQQTVPRGKTLRHVIAHDQDAQNAFRVLARRYVAGTLHHPIPALPRFILEEIDTLVSATDVYCGTWVDVVVKAGGTLQFDPPGPYSVVAHSLTVEPGGSVVTNQAHISWDCSSITIQ